MIRHRTVRSVPAGAPRPRAVLRSTPVLDRRVGPNEFEPRCYDPCGTPMRSPAECRGARSSNEPFSRSNRARDRTRFEARPSARSRVLEASAGKPGLRLRQTGGWPRSPLWQRRRSIRALRLPGPRKRADDRLRGNLFRAPRGTSGWALRIDAPERRLGPRAGFCPRSGPRPLLRDRSRCYPNELRRRRFDEFFFEKAL